MYFAVKGNDVNYFHMVQKKMQGWERKRQEKKSMQQTLIEESKQMEYRCSLNSEQVYYLNFSRGLKIFKIKREGENN